MADEANANEGGRWAAQDTIPPIAGNGAQIPGLSALYSRPARQNGLGGGYFWPRVFRRTQRQEGQPDGGRLLIHKRLALLLRLIFSFVAWASRLNTESGAARIREGGAQDVPLDLSI
jgi:hypothetical protein